MSANSPREVLLPLLYSLVNTLEDQQSLNLNKKIKFFTGGRKHTAKQLTCVLSYSSFNVVYISFYCLPQPRRSVQLRMQPLVTSQRPDYGSLSSSSFSRDPMRSLSAEGHEQGAKCDIYRRLLWIINLLLCWNLGMNEQRAKKCILYVWPAGRYRPRSPPRAGTTTSVCQ